MLQRLTAQLTGQQYYPPFSSFSGLIHISSSASSPSSLIPTKPPPALLLRKYPHIHPVPPPLSHHLHPCSEQTIPTHRTSTAQNRTFPSRIHAPSSSSPNQGNHTNPSRHAISESTGWILPPKAEMGFRCRRRGGGWSGAEGVSDFVAEINSEEEVLVLFLAEEEEMERGWSFG
ncbi:MAG: hypothetical protein Q9172_005833 [Xanthocarpia lactea]